MCGWVKSELASMDRTLHRRPSFSPFKMRIDIGGRFPELVDPIRRTPMSALGQKRT
jgi:hypothetical protein